MYSQSLVKWFVGHRELGFLGLFERQDRLGAAPVSSQMPGCINLAAPLLQPNEKRGSCRERLGTPIVAS